MTEQRRTIIKALCKIVDQPDVEQFHELVRQHDSTVSIATTYRTLRLLEDNGLIQPRIFANGRASFDPFTKSESYLMFDVDSGRLSQLETGCLADAIRQAVAGAGYAALSIKVEVQAKRLAPAQKRTRMVRRP